MPNWMDAIQAGLAGAGSGAGVGSTIGGPGAGTAIGAGIGGLGAFLTSLFQGGGGIEQIQNLSPEQQSILQFLLQQGQQGLENPYEGFDDIANQAREQFSQQTVPSLAERFTSMGNNSLGSGAFASQLGQAGVGLQSNLAAQRAQYGMQNKQNAMQMLQLGLRPSFENVERKGFGETALAGTLKAAPKFYESYLKNQQLQANPVR